MKNSKKYLGISLRGIAMGAADVIPGVSGGTIAFITGIYEELIETLSNLNLGLLKTWKNEGFKAMWKKGNFNFLLALFLGVAVSIVSLAKLISFLLHEYPIHLWSFFFGLILASIWLVGKTVEKWNATTISGFIAGTAIAYVITMITPTGESDNYAYIFLCGALAICAMILPGISGSFILLLLGAYTTILGSVNDLTSALKAKDWEMVTDNGLLIAIFMLGCLFGLILFSKLLNWLFKKAKNLIIAILSGFLLGSLNKIWPWKITLESFQKEPGGEEIPLVQENVLPGNFENLTGSDAHLGFAIALCILGFVIIFILDRFSPKKKASESV